MSQLTIVANILAKEENQELVKAELLKLVAITKTEKGCITYRLHQDNNNDNFFLVYEIWESTEALEQHSKSKHMLSFLDKTKEAIQEFTVNKMTFLG